jgi:hypothetical protein
MMVGGDGERWQGDFSGQILADRWRLLLRGFLNNNPLKTFKY